MNNTMVRRFCTLKDAAERLGVTQEQIESLLRRGILREFRDGPCRLLRTADVAGIFAARDRRIEREGRPQTEEAAGRPPSERGGRFSPDHPGCTPVSGSAATVSRTHDRDDVRPGTARAGRKDRDFEPFVPMRDPAASRSVGRPISSRRSHTAKGRMRPETASERRSVSVREWFWAGLTQDRPITIALLSALVLLALSTAVVGACMLAGIV